MYRQLVFAMLGLAVATVLAGCSGAGTTAEEVQEGVPGAASRVLSAFTLVTSWTSMLYPPTSQPQTYHERPVVIDGRPATRVWGVYSDGGEYVSLRFADGSGTATVTWEDRSLRESWSSGELSDDGLLTQSGSLVLSTGARLRWQSVADTIQQSYPEVITGAAAAADGQKMTYQLRREQNADDEVSASLPDGSTLHLQCPTRVGAGSAHVPVRQQGLTGSYELAGTGVTFVLTGTEGGWTAWQTSDSGGLSGQFSLADNMAASGTISNATGETLGLLRWTASRAGALSLVGAGEMEVTPSAAALKFQITSWVANAALIGPAPLY